MTAPRMPWCAAGFGVGLVALGVGVGLGGPHLAKVGWSLPTLIGGLLLVTGLAVVVGSGVRIVRATPRWWRLAVVPGLLVAAYVVALPVGIAVAATNVPPTTVGATTPADRGLDYEDVGLRTEDGVRLSGWYLPSHNGAALALLHGAGSTRSSVLDHAVVLAEHGFGVLLLDARGHGESDGEAMDLGWHGDADVEAAMSFLAERGDVDDRRIGVVGMSMGGEEAIGASASDRRIAAVVAEGATGRVAADDEWLSDVHGPRGWLQEQVGRLQTTLVGLLSDADEPASLHDAVAESSAPTLLIAAGDVPDEADAATYIRAGSPEDVDVWIAPGAGHTDGLRVAPDDWARRVVGFLENALRVGS